MRSRELIEKFRVGLQKRQLNHKNQIKNKNEQQQKKSSDRSEQLLLITYRYMQRNPIM